MSVSTIFFFLALISAFISGYSFGYLSGGRWRYGTNSVKDYEGAGSNPRSGAVIEEYYGPDRPIVETVFMDIPIIYAEETKKYFERNGIIVEEKKSFDGIVFSRLVGNKNQWPFCPPRTRKP